MPFYKRENDNILVSLNVNNQNYVLSEETHLNNTYPIDNWFWYPNMDTALIGFSSMQLSSTTLTKFQFLSRFTKEERILIRNTAKTNDQLFDFMQMLELSGEIQLTNPETTSGVRFLEVAGLLAAGRADQILVRL